MSGTGIEVVPYLPKCRVPVLKSYRTYRSVGYRYRGRTELTEVSGIGIELVQYLPKCRIQVLKLYSTYRSVGYRYFVPSLSKCRIPLSKFSPTLTEDFCRVFTTEQKLYPRYTFNTPYKTHSPLFSPPRKCWGHPHTCLFFAPTTFVYTLLALGTLLPNRPEPSKLDWKYC